MGRELSIIAAIILIVFGLFFFWKSEDFVENQSAQKIVSEEMQVLRKDFLQRKTYSGVVRLAELEAEYYRRPARRKIMLQYEDKKSNLVGIVEKVNGHEAIGVCGISSTKVNLDAEKFKHALKKQDMFTVVGDVSLGAPNKQLDQGYTCMMILMDHPLNVDFDLLPSHLIESLFRPAIDSQESK